MVEISHFTPGSHSLAPRFLSGSCCAVDLVALFANLAQEGGRWVEQRIAIRRGDPAAPLPALNAKQAAGRIHSDLERGFIRAEVIPYAVFMAHGSEQAVKTAGLLQIEGKDYVVADGDILHVRFNV